MRLFRPEIERFIKYVATGAVIGAFALPLEWGYHQRQEARTWREAACVYRLRDLVRLGDSAGSTGSLVRTAHPGDPCATLRRLGVDVDSWKCRSDLSAAAAPPSLTPISCSRIVRSH